MTFKFTRRRVLIFAGSFALVLFLGALAARLYFAGQVVVALLKDAGATEIRLQISQASLWRVVVQDVGFLLRLQPFAAQRVTLERAHWWTPSLGTLRVEQAKLSVNLDTLPKTEPTVAADKSGGPTQLPLEGIYVDGQLVVQAAGLPDQALTVKFEARPAAGGRWEGKGRVTAPGLDLKAEGQYQLTSGDLMFKVPTVTLDLKTWQGFLQHLAPQIAGDWELEGKLSGSAEGRWADDKLVAGGSVQLREGRASSTAQAITAEGIEADLVFTDFAQFTTKPGSLHIRELRTGQLTLRDLAAEFALEGTDRIAVAHASLLALGGSVTAEPFRYVPSRAELDAVLLVDGISVEEVMALTKDLPAKASGRVNGRVPVRISSEGLRLGTGWLALKPGVYAEIQFNAKGLLTGGASPSSPSYVVLQKVESGLLKLQISELRLDIRPTNAPEGRSAQLHIAGEPVDKEVKAPVTLDLNVNGPIEKLLNMGMNSRLSFGAGK